MHEPKLIRPIAAMALATGLFFTLAGCANNKPPSENKGDKKTDPSSNPNPTLNINQNSNTTPPSDPPTKITPPTVEHIDLNVGVGMDATNFLASLKNGVVKGDQLSQGFLKAIGLPVVFKADKDKGYSADAAEALLRPILSQLGLGPLSVSKQVGDVALFRGMLIGSGELCLRMIHEGGGWKVDWLSLTSVPVQGGALNTSSADVVCQEFAVAAVIGLLMDKDALTKETRATILGAGLSPTLKKKWAEPLDSDRAEGFDYNRGLLAQKAAAISAGVESVAFTQQGSSTDFRVEAVLKGGAKKAYLVKLAKGPGNGQWLVDDVIPE